MATPIAGGARGGKAEYFLHLQTKRAGKIKGEATAEGHGDDIIVSSWNWGLSSGAALGDSRVHTRRSYTALNIVKQIDSASTGLMSALATNDEVKEARLALRRAGGEQEAYLTLTLRGARVTALQHVGLDDGSTHETLSLAFTEVEVEYRPQKSSGQRSGASTFVDQLPDGS